MNALLPFDNRVRDLAAAASRVSAADISSRDMEVLLTAVPIVVMVVTAFVGGLLALRDALRGLTPRRLFVTCMYCGLAFVASASAVIHGTLFLSQSFAGFAEHGADGNAATSVVNWFVEDSRAAHFVNLTIGTKAQWLFTSQLLHFQCVLAVVAFVEGMRSAQRWPLPLAFIGATVSPALAFALLLACVGNAGSENRKLRLLVPLARPLLAAVLLASLCIVVLPDASDALAVLSVALAALVAPAALLQFVPGAFRHAGPPQGLVLLARNSRTGETARVLDQRPLRHQWLVGLYAALGGFALQAHLRNVMFVVTEPVDGSLALRLVTAMLANAAQQKVSADLFLASLTFVLYVIFSAEGKLRVRLVAAVGAAVPLVGVSVALPLFMAYRETALPTPAKPTATSVAATLRPPTATGPLTAAQMQLVRSGHAKKQAKREARTASSLSTSAATTGSSASGAAAASSELLPPASSVISSVAGSSAALDEDFVPPPGTDDEAAPVAADVVSTAKKQL